VSTIRVTDETHRRIAALSKQTGHPMTEVVDEAVEALERKVFFSELDARFLALRADPDAWREIEAERSQEESALSDDAG
jgi:predicted DNA-binding protein